MTAKKSTPSSDDLPFEKALDRLEQVVDEMETGELSLDDMIARFEEGTRLARQCEKRLAGIEQKIEQLVQRGDELTTEPFDPEE